MNEPSLSSSSTPVPRILIPFDSREALTLRRAAKLVGRSESTVRTWCDRYHIGRRIAGGAKSISKVALAMLVDGEMDALAAYHDGARAQYEPVARYYRRLDLGDLLKLREFGGQE